MFGRRTIFHPAAFLLLLNHLKIWTPLLTKAVSVTRMAMPLGNSRSTWQESSQALNGFANETYEGSAV
jgi:hypothetical protein